ncbi:hypothetical protein CXQ85_002097 [Candidozyma haemuli]|uniref:Uncharacterized protein n=1 Tax=Candidozyma haemuli TaxID=45357 RepID=A0A2V1AQG0_9ASCO|nr:hypothetical protein CXQ85_002097 [[Candida] haemuloni]PVH20310.1 hypothetical protein CXQ85_002097 [[Candida] haemuloni]
MSMITVTSPSMFSKLNPLNALHRRSNNKEQEQPPKRQRAGSFMRIWRRSSSTSSVPQTKVVNRSQLTRHNITAAQALSAGPPSPRRRRSDGSTKSAVRSNDLLSSDFILPLEMKSSRRS